MDIIIDTEIMNQIASFSYIVVEKIEAAIKNYNSVTCHDDWSCKEHDEINEQISRLKTDISKMSEEIVTFAQKVNNLADKFNGFDSLLLSRFSSFDSSVGSMLAIDSGKSGMSGMSGGSETAKGSYITKILESNLSGKLPMNYLENYAITNSYKPLSVVHYSDSLAVTAGSPLTNIVNNDVDSLMKMYLT